MTGVTSSIALWYASRATGIVLLVLLSAVAILGVLVNRQGRLPGLPRFAVTGLHRNLALLATSFLAVHVLTAVMDSYVSIQLVAAVVPFTSTYEPLWIGLGAVAFDLLVAVVITSLVRLWIGRRVWRAVHWLTYAVYPVSVAHSIGSSRDLQSGGLLILTIGCVVAVCAAAGYRIVGTVAAGSRWRRVPTALRYTPSDPRTPTRPASHRIEEGSAR